MPYKVAVIMGGKSHEREFSLSTGQHVCEALERAGHTPLALDTTDELVPTLLEEKPDVAYSALHGKLGEDGTIQSLMELLNIPLVGCAANVCRQAWNKATLPATLKRWRASGAGLALLDGAAEGPAAYPTGVCLSQAAFKDMGAAYALDLVCERIPAGYPLAVKPACQGSALGFSRVEDATQLAKALLKAFSFGEEAVIEEWVDGVQLAVGVLGTGPNTYALPPVEIAPKHGLYDTEARLDPEAVDFFAPVRLASLSDSEADAQAIRSEIERAAVEVHRAYGARDLSRVDIIWDGARARVLEIDSSPGMGDLSGFPMACTAAGLSLDAVLSELLDQAVARS